MTNQQGSIRTDLVDLVHPLVYIGGMQVNMHEAKTHFSRIVDRAIAGELVVIAKNGKPVLTLSPLQTASSARVPGLSRGKAIFSADFDAPLDPAVLQEFE